MIQILKNIDNLTLESSTAHKCGKNDIKKSIRTKLVVLDLSLDK